MMWNGQCYRPSTPVTGTLIRLACTGMKQKLDVPLIPRSQTVPSNEPIFGWPTKSGAPPIRSNLWSKLVENH